MTRRAFNVARLFGVIVGWGIVAAAFGAEIPTSQELVRRVRPEHPRLFLNANEFRELRERAGDDKFLKSCAAEARSRANKLLGEPPAKYEIPDGKRLLATSRKVVDRVYTLAMTYQLEGGRKYKDRLFQELEAVAEFKDWNPSHFLDTAEMTHAVAVAYDWLYDDWSAEQRALIREALVKHGLSRGAEVYRKKSGWSRADHNWNQVCNGGMMLGALAVADEEPELAGQIMHAALASLPIAMASYAPDGAWGEGPGYWGYATTYNVLFLAGCQSALQTDFDLSQLPGFSSTGLFPVYMTGTSGKGFNFEDAGDSAPHGSCLFWLDQQFNQPVGSWAEVTYGRPSAQSMVWYRRPGQSPAEAGLPLDKQWNGVEVATLRSSWSDPAATYVAIQAGSNQVNHNHLDVGSFVIDALGERWAIDLAGDNYNLPGYFGKQRYDYYRLRAEGHNCFVLDPGEGPDQDPKAGGRIEKVDSSTESATVTADLTPVYQASASAARRKMTLDRSTGTVELVDQITPHKKSDIWWFWHTGAQIEIAPDGRMATLRQDGKVATLRLVEPSAAKLIEQPAQPLPSSPNPPGQAENRHARKLVIHLSDAGDTTIRVAFSPEK